MNQQTPYPPNQGQQPMQIPQTAQQVDYQGYATQAYPAQPQTQSPAPAPAPAEPAGKSGLAIAGLVLGIVAMATSFMPIINNASFFIGLIGLVLGIIGFVQTRKGTKSGAGLAIAAIVLNVVACVVVLASQAFYSSVLDEAMNSAGISTSASSSSASQGAAAQASPAQAAESDYAVTIDSATLGTDYQGNPAVIVTYSWTNDSDKATSFAVALHAKCFQDGVQCDTAIVTGTDSNYMTEIKPGASTTVQLAYTVSGTSDVTVEVTELISLSSEVLAEKTFSLA